MEEDEATKNTADGRAVQKPTEDVENDQLTVQGGGGGGEEDSASDSGSGSEDAEADDNGSDTESSSSSSSSFSSSSTATSDDDDDDESSSSSSSSSASSSDDDEGDDDSSTADGGGGGEDGDESSNPYAMSDLLGGASSAAAMASVKVYPSLNGRDTAALAAATAASQHTAAGAATTPPVGSGFPMNWNEKFQAILDKAENTAEARLCKYRELSALAHDFVHASKTYGKIIVQENFLPRAYKTIKPADHLGGQAGGEKYIYHGIIFKFATDWKGLYRGDQYAAKSAGHELKSLMRFYGLVPGLRIPLMSLIDYRGFRLVAMSILPIENDTLVYGSNDYGQHVWAKNERFNKIMAVAGRKLKLKGHVAGFPEAPYKQEFIYGPADIEGHIGKDGRNYVIDLARVCPPVAKHVTYTVSDREYTEVMMTGVNLPGSKKAKKRKEFRPPPPLPVHLFRLFRPEFLASYGRPLSSDAFSGFGGHDSAIHNREIEDATIYLESVVITKFSLWLEDNEPGTTSDDHSLSQLMHRNGINVRYLGVLYHLAKRSAVKKGIFREICVRVIKNALRDRLREKMRTLGATIAEEPYRVLVMEFLNMVLGRVEGSPNDEESSAHFWHVELKQSILKDFMASKQGTSAASGGDGNDPTVLFLLLLQHAREVCQLFGRMKQLCGFDITERAQTELQRKGAAFELVYPDIKKVSVRVRNMNMILLAEASTLHLQSVQQWSREQGGSMQIEVKMGVGSFIKDPKGRYTGGKAERLFQLAMTKYEKAIEATPDNVEIMKRYGDALITQAQLTGPNLVAHSLCEMALRMYRLALDDSAEQEGAQSEAIQREKEAKEVHDDSATSSDKRRFSRCTTSDLLRSLEEEDRRTRGLGSEEDEQEAAAAQEAAERDQIKDDAWKYNGLIELTAWLERTMSERRASRFGNRQLRLKFIAILRECYGLLTKSVCKNDENEHMVWLKWGLLLLEEARQLKRKEDFMKLDYTAKRDTAQETSASLYSKSGSYFRRALIAARKRKWKKESELARRRRGMDPFKHGADSFSTPSLPTKGGLARLSLTLNKRASFKDSDDDEDDELSAIQRSYGPVLGWMENGLLLDDHELAQIMELKQRCPSLVEIHSEWCGTPLTDRVLSILLRLANVKTLHLVNCDRITDMPFTSSMIQKQKALQHSGERERVVEARLAVEAQRRGSVTERGRAGTESDLRPRVVNQPERGRRTTDISTSAPLANHISHVNATPDDEGEPIKSLSASMRPTRSVRSIFKHDKRPSVVETRTKLADEEKPKSPRSNDTPRAEKGDIKEIKESNKIRREESSKIRRSVGDKEREREKDVLLTPAGPTKEERKRHRRSRSFNDLGDISLLHKLLAAREGGASPGSESARTAPRSPPLRPAIPRLTLPMLSSSTGSSNTKPSDPIPAVVSAEPALPSPRQMGACPAPITALPARLIPKTVSGTFTPVSTSPLLPRNSVGITGEMRISFTFEDTALSTSSPLIETRSNRVGRKRSTTMSGPSPPPSPSRRSGDSAVLGFDPENPPPLGRSPSFEFKFDDPSTGMPSSTSTLTVLHIENCPNVSDVIIRRWVEACVDLRVLNLTKTQIFSEPVVAVQQPSGPISFSSARHLRPKLPFGQDKNPGLSSQPSSLSAALVTAAPATGQSAVPASPPASPKSPRETGWSPSASPPPSPSSSPSPSGIGGQVDLQKSSSHSSMSSAITSMLSPRFGNRGGGGGGGGGDRPAQTTFLRGTALLSFSPTFAHLTELNLSYSHHIGDENKLLFITLGKKLIHLRTLDLSWSRITDINLKHLLRSCLGDESGTGSRDSLDSSPGGGLVSTSRSKEGSDLSSTTATSTSSSSILRVSDGIGGDESDGGQADSEDSEDSNSINKSKIRKRVRAKLKTSNGDHKKENERDKPVRDGSSRQLVAGDTLADRERRSSKESIDRSNMREGSLTYLNLTRCLRLTEKSIKHITKRGVSLQTLILSGASDCVTDRSLEWIGDSLSNLTKLDISNCHEVSSVAPLIINRRRSVVVDGVGIKKENERKRGLKKQERKEEKEREKEEKREKKREKEEEKEEKKRKKRMFIKRRTEKKRDNKESGHASKIEGAERPLSDDSTDIDIAIERETRLSVSGGAADDREGEKDSIGSRKDKPREVKAKDKEKDKEKETVAMLEEALAPSLGCPKLVDLNIFACNKLTGKGEEIARIAKSRSQLQSISLYQTDHTDKVIRSFAKNCPSLRFIRVSHCDDISDVAINALALNCAELEGFILLSCPAITASSIHSLAVTCTALKHLCLNANNNINDYVLQTICWSCRSLEHLSLWKNERISDEAFDFTEREEEEKQKRRMEEKRERDLEREIADLSLQQQRKVNKKQRRNAGKERLADDEDEEAEKDTELQDETSIDPKALERKNRRAMRKEKSRIMLVRSSSTLLYQIMREGAITLQQQQHQQPAAVTAASASSIQLRQHDEGKESTAKSPAHSPVSPRANSSKPLTKGKSDTSPGKKVSIKKKDKKRKAGIAASAGMVETRPHYHNESPPPRVRLSSFSAESLPILQPAAASEPATPAPSTSTSPTAAVVPPRAVLPPALYNLKSLCLKNCPKITDRTLDMLWQRCPHLQRLNVTHCPLLSNHKLMWLQEVYVQIDIVCNDRSQLKGVRGSGGPWNFQGFSY